MYYVLNLIAALHARIEDAKDRGATATEYAMLVAFIAIAIVVAVTVLRRPAERLVQHLGNKIGIDEPAAPVTRTSRLGLTHGRAGPDGSRPRPRARPGPFTDPASYSGIDFGRVQ